METHTFKTLLLKLNKEQVSQLKINKKIINKLKGQSIVLKYVATEDPDMIVPISKSSQNQLDEIGNVKKEKHLKFY